MNDADKRMRAVLDTMILALITIRNAPRDPKSLEDMEKLVKSLPLLSRALLYYQNTETK